MAKPKSPKSSKKDLEDRLAKLESEINRLLVETERKDQQPPPSQETPAPPETPSKETPAPPETPSPTSTSTDSTAKSRKEILEEYEKDYLVRLEKQRQEAEAQRAAEELEAEKAAQLTTRGSMPRGWKPS